MKLSSNSILGFPLGWEIIEDGVLLRVEADTVDAGTDEAEWFDITVETSLNPRSSFYRKIENITIDDGLDVASFKPDAVDDIRSYLLTGFHCSKRQTEAVCQEIVTVVQLIRNLGEVQ